MIFLYEHLLAGLNKMTNTIVLKFIIIIMILDLTEIDKWMTTRCQGVPDDAKRSRYLMDKHFCLAHLVWF